MKRKLQASAAVATAAITVSGIPVLVVVILTAIVSPTGIETAHGSILPSNVTDRPEIEEEIGESEDIDEVIATHLDNAEREVMQGNNTAAILELVRAIRLVHGVTETALLGNNFANQTTPMTPSDSS